MHMFFQLKDKATKEKETYDLLVELVKAVLHYECPEHRANYHILYSANHQLEMYQEAQACYRLHCNPSTSLGNFSAEAYQLATKKYNQLYTTIRGYMHLSEESHREHFNHHFRFHKEKIEVMHALFQKKQERRLLNLEQAFFEGLKEDLLPILTQLE
jgi:hypothetical protein